MALAGVICSFVCDLKCLLSAERESTVQLAEQRTDTHSASILY